MARSWKITCNVKGYGTIDHTSLITTPGRTFTICFLSHLLSPYSLWLIMLSNSAYRKPAQHTPRFRNLFLNFVFLSRWTTIVSVIFLLTLSRKTFVSISRCYRRRLAFLLRAAAVANQHPVVCQDILHMNYACTFANRLRGINIGISC